MPSLRADNHPTGVRTAVGSPATSIGGRGHPASSNNSSPRVRPATEPESIRVAERRKAASGRERGFASLFVDSDTNPRTLSVLYKEYIRPGGDENRRPVLRENLKGGIGAATDLWNAFVMSAAEGSDLLASSLATGHFWAPRTQAVATMKSALLNPQFKELFIKVEAGPLNMHYTGIKAAPWDFTTTEDALLRKNARFANLFIWEMSLLVDDERGDFVTPMRTETGAFLTRYPIVGDVFPINLEEGSGLLRSAALRILEQIGVDPTGVKPVDEELQLALFSSICCVQLAKRFINIAGPENVAFGLRRTAIVKTDATDREHCVLPYTVLAHAANMITSWLILFASCTAEPRTREFLSELDRTLSDDEVENLVLIFKRLDFIQWHAKDDAKRVEFHGVKTIVQDMDDEMELWALDYSHIFIPAK